MYAIYAVRYYGATTEHGVGLGVIANMPLKLARVRGGVRKTARPRQALYNTPYTRWLFFFCISEAPEQYRSADGAGLRFCRVQSNREQ